MTMPAYTDLTGLGGIALACAATSLAIPGVQRLSPARLATLLAVIAVAVLVPLGPLPLAVCLRGATGDLSITTLVLLGGAIRRGLLGWPPPERHGRFALLGGIAGAALGLYPMALGVGLLDPYRSGYGSPWLVGGLLVVALAAWFGRLPVIATCLALATLGWTLRWYESTNLWDYLLDPLVGLYALGAVASRGARRLLGSFRGEPAGA